MISRAEFHVVMTWAEAEHWRATLESNGANSLVFLPKKVGGPDKVAVGERLQVILIDGIQMP